MRRQTAPAGSGSPWKPSGLTQVVSCRSPARGPFSSYSFICAHWQANGPLAGWGPARLGSRSLQSMIVRELATARPRQSRRLSLSPPLGPPPSLRVPPSGSPAPPLAHTRAHTLALSLPACLPACPPARLPACLPALPLTRARARTQTPRQTPHLCPLVAVELAAAVPPGYPFPPSFLHLELVRLCTLQYIWN